jgi:hypothetical protein
MIYRFYLSGPMTGMPDANRAAFTEAAASLRRRGASVINPAENGLPEDAGWAEHLRTDIRDMMDCNAIHMLPGWSSSKGARLEHHIAQQLGFAITGAQA